MSGGLIALTLGFAYAGHIYLLWRSTHKSDHASQDAHEGHTGTWPGKATVPGEELPTVHCGEYD